MRKTFLQYLEEKPAWTESASRHIFADDVHLPLSTSMFRRIFGSGKPPRMTVFHVANPKFIDDMVALQGKRKSISAFSHMSRDLISQGINVVGGLVFQLKADVFISSPYDIMSRPDKTGRRWLELYYLRSIYPDLTHLLFKDGEKAVNRLIEKYLGHKVPLTSTFNTWSSLDPRNEKSPLSKKLRGKKQKLGVKRGEAQYTSKEIRKLLHAMVKDYIDAMEGVMKKHADQLAETLWKHATTPKDSKFDHVEYDEYVVNRIKIVRVLVDRETIMKSLSHGSDWKEMDDEEREEVFDNEVRSKLSAHRLAYNIYDNATQVMQAIHVALPPK